MSPRMTGGALRPRPAGTAPPMRNSDMSNHVEVTAILAIQHQSWTSFSTWMKARRPAGTWRWPG